MIFKMIWAHFANTYLVKMVSSTNKYAYTAEFYLLRHYEESAI